jgi:hypothetical protein
MANSVDYPEERATEKKFLELEKHKAICKK